MTDNTSSFNMSDSSDNLNHRVTTHSGSNNSDTDEKSITGTQPERNIQNLMEINYSYPDPTDPELQSKLYKKREFYYHKIPSRPDMKDYNEIKEYRDNLCGRSFALYEHQALVGNFINPNTPYKGILIFHGLGTGKCNAPETLIYVNGILMRSDSIWKEYAGAITKDNDGGEWAELKDKLIINTINDEGKIERKEIKKLYREYVKTNLREIVLENGMSIRITQPHKLLKIDGWSNDLKVGDYVSIPKKLYNSVDKNKLYVSDDLAYLTGRQISDTIDNYNGEGIPSFIMNSDLSKIKIFLKAYFDAWAYINERDDIIEISSGSEIIIRQLDVLCRQFGINMRFREIQKPTTDLKIEKTYYGGLISGSSLRIFKEHIGFSIDSKLEALNKICQRTSDTKIDLETEKEIYYVKIQSIRKTSYEGYVYDMEIDRTHNYVANGIMCHNTCTGVSCAESFKSMVKKYNTKIYVLVSGPLIKENWKEHLLLCTGETYLKHQDKSIYVDEAEKMKNRKNALTDALQYYKFMSYRSFYKRVLGEKIVDRKVVKGAKVKVSYRKTDEGEFERDIAVDRIYNLNNSLIIVDEAHNLTGNAYGEALKHIIKNSMNLKVVLMSATPMKNLADDIVELLNFIRPLDAPIERDKIFTSNKNHTMEIKERGIEYFKKMANGYISHVRGADPLIFARRIDKGVKPEGLIFTKVIRCHMLELQRKTYDLAVRDVDDTLDRKSEAVANFVFPGLTQDRKELVGYYGRDGLNFIKNQLKINYDLLNKRIATDIYKDEKEKDLMYITQSGKTITGKIFKMPNLKYFSVKFYKAFKKLSELVWGKKGPKTAFVYSNLVKVGIDLFQEVLLQNGYLEYQEDSTGYQLNPDTICYFCGRNYADHQSGAYLKDQVKDIKDNNKNKSKIVDVSDSDSEYDEYKYHMKTDTLPIHQFYPATFISITGKSSEESADVIPEDKKRILDNVYNIVDNKEGKYIKLVLGSRVMNEGISLKQVGEVHILDVYFNLGKVDQVVGRAIRNCSHYKLMSEQHKFPYVNVYKYVVSLENGLSTEEELYKKAEMKYLLIKKLERAMKEVAIDCPMNIKGNMFKEEMDAYKDCDEPGKEACPGICDYTKCWYKCADVKLNAEYYDPSRMIYKTIPKDKLDYSTFTHGLARNEIDHAKTKIKEMYITSYMYTLKDILNYVKNSYDDEKRELFDEFFVYKGLDELIPVTENDFNNFKDTITDKHNRPGYLIYINEYYIFQPFDQNEDVPMYYRTSYVKPVTQKLSLYNYLKNTIEYQQFKGVKGRRKEVDTKILLRDEQSVYDFDSTMDYYDGRDEFKYVGIIDKELSRRKSKGLDEIKDVFKIREKRAKILEKKRGTGIPSLKGAVCSTSKAYNYLVDIAKELRLNSAKTGTRIDICEAIKEKMLMMEKYATGKDKKTYIMIPANHPDYPFPYNLEDRAEYIVKKIKNEVGIKLDINIIPKKKTSGDEKGQTSYQIRIKSNDKLIEFETFLKSLGAQKEKNEWIININ